MTENLSSAGFYCFSLTPLKIGESVRCLLEMPVYPGMKDEPLTIECLVRVVRIEKLAESFGIGCQIEIYHTHKAELSIAPAHGM